eukprot:1379622-Pyramimonas_sp.AAC.1
MCEPERDDIYPITLPSDPPRVLLGREVPWGDVLAGRVDDRKEIRHLCAGRRKPVPCGYVALLPASGRSVRVNRNRGAYTLCDVLSRHPRAFGSTPACVRPYAATLLSGAFLRMPRCVCAAVSGHTEISNDIVSQGLEASQRPIWASADRLRSVAGTRLQHGKAWPPQCSPIHTATLAAASPRNPSVLVSSDGHK